MRKIITGLGVGLLALSLVGCAKGEAEDIPVASEGVIVEAVMPEQEVTPEISLFEEALTASINKTDEAVPNGVGVYDLLIDAYRKLAAQRSMKLVSVTRTDSGTSCEERRWNTETGEMSLLRENELEDESSRVAKYMIFDGEKYVVYSPVESKKNNVWVLDELYYYPNTILNPEGFMEWFQFPHFLRLSDTYVEFNGEKCYHLVLDSEEPLYGFDLYIRESDGSLCGMTMQSSIFVFAEDDGVITVPVDTTGDVILQESSREPITEAPEFFYDLGNTPISDFRVSLSNPELTLGDTIGNVNDSTVEPFVYEDVYSFCIEDGAIVSSSLEDEGLVEPGSFIQYTFDQDGLLTFMYGKNDTAAPCAIEDCQAVGYVYDEKSLYAVMDRRPVLLDFISAWGEDYVSISPREPDTIMYWDKGDYKIFSIGSGYQVHYVYIVHESLIPIMYKRLATHQISREQIDSLFFGE